jgi:SAM-dependent methyltransferase
MAQQEVRDFYESTGWEYVGEVSQDALINENLTHVASEYVSKVRLRIRENIGSGKAILDVGSGPIQYPEYLAYSDNFETRVCVDLSKKALEIAKKRIGEKGRTVEGDFLKLPQFPEAPFDGAALINVLYHVEKSNQNLLVRKILDNLNQGSRLVVVYSDAGTLSARLTGASLRMKRLVKGIWEEGNSSKNENPIYFYRHRSQFWRQFEDVSRIEIRAWRTFSPPLEKLFFKKMFFGRYFLRILYKLEKINFWAKIAEYQLIVITKK